MPGGATLPAPLGEICAGTRFATSRLEARRDLPRSRWVDIAYEDLVRAPVDELERICGQLGVDFGEHARAYASGLAQAPAATSLTEPRPEKWRDQNPDAIDRILPLVAEIERQLGYDAS